MLTMRPKGVVALSFRRKVYFALALALSVSGTAFLRAQAATPVEYLAAHLGFTVIEDAVSGTVTLKRPGAVIILLPGSHVYTVNGRAEVADQVPTARNGLVYVAAPLAAELSRIAAATQSRTLRALPRLSQMDFTGKLALTVRAVPGQTQIAISGTGPAGAEVAIMLRGVISADLPNVILSRHRVQIGPDGTFYLATSTAPLYTIGTQVLVDATAGVGVTPASASIVLGQPNSTVVSPLDTLSTGE